MVRGVRVVVECVCGSGRVGLDFTKLCRNRGSVGHVSVLQRCGVMLGEDWAIVWEGSVVCVCCESGFFVLMASPGICIMS